MSYRILLIFPGPEYNIKKEKIEALSERFVGTVVTSSPRRELCETVKVSAFDYCCFKLTYKNRFFSNLKYMLLILNFCMKERFKDSKYDLVVTYDPLKTGVFGAICSSILKCKFAPEVNGVYHSPAEYLDGPTISTQIKKVAYPLIQQWVLNRADGIKTLFPEQVHGIVSAENTIIHSFPNHVEIDRFLSLPLDVSSHVILFVGFPFRRKGVDILIEAFKVVYPKFQDWELVILGWYPDRELLEKHINSHSNIKYCPPVEYSEMPEVLSRCSIFVMPSRSEAMGRALVESMAAGKARIGSQVDGIPYVIDNGTDGLLFENGNASSLAVQLERLMSDEALRNKLAVNSRKRAVGFFTKEQYFNNIERFYKKVIERDLSRNTRK